MKKGDIVERVQATKGYTFDNIAIGDFGVVVRGPYEKNISDILYSSYSKSLTSKTNLVEIKRVIDILQENKIYKYRLVSDYERVRT